MSATGRVARRASTRGVALAAWLVALLVAPLAADELPAPPVDAADEEDVTFERADTTRAEGVEVEVGLRGSGGSPMRRDRRVVFRGEDLDASVREGVGDPLAGAEMGGGGSLGRWRMGRNAPQWSRGALVGSPLAPWSTGAGETDGLHTGPRGDAAQFGIGERVRVEGLAGHFAKRDVAALRVGFAGIAVAAAGSRAGFAGGSLAGERGAWGSELAVDARGRWRAELAASRAAATGRVRLLARAGSGGWRALLAPTRSGPAQALAAAWDGGPRRVRARARSGLWRFGPGYTGGRAALEVDLGLAQHAALTLGTEEQRGTRRERTSTRGMQQGWWGEWRGGGEPVRLELRVETWGRGTRASRPMRAVSGASVELRTPFGSRLRAEHRVFRSGRGETLRLPEVEADRLVLRSLSGAGERTSLEWTMPGPAGRLRAGLSFTAAVQRSPRAQWTIHWAKRARVGRGPP